MPHYANADERSRFISGLRALAEYLESSPDVPAPWGETCIHVFPPQCTNEERRGEIDAIASRINAEPCETVNGHYTVSRFFGPVEYRAVAIDRTADDAGGK